MRGNGLFTTFVASVCLTGFLHADCAKGQDHRSSKNSGLLITDFSISGTQTLNSAQLDRIRSKLTGSCFDENSEELEERVRALFQDEGYFAMELKSTGIKLSDPLAVPKLATLEADILEGPRYKVAEIEFTGNRAFSAAKLRGEFPLKKGDLFQRYKIAGGLEGIRKLYASHGFVDFMAMPDTQSLSNATILLTVAVMEGPQYRMGHLDILAKKEIADRLRNRWLLPEGTIFDLTYIDSFINANRSLLTVGFTRGNVQLVRKCPEALVEVTLPLDSSAFSQSQPKSVECESSNETAK